MIYIQMAILLFVEVAGMVLSVAVLFASFMHPPQSLVLLPASVLLMAGTLYLLLNVSPKLLDKAT